MHFPLPVMFAGKELQIICEKSIIPVQSRWKL